MRPLSFGEYITLPLVLSGLIMATRMVHVPFESVPVVIHMIDGGADSMNLLLVSMVSYALR